MTPKSKKNLGREHCPLPNPSFCGEGDTSSLHPTPIGACGASTRLALSALNLASPNFNSWIRLWLYTHRFYHPRCLSLVRCRRAFRGSKPEPPRKSDVMCMLILSDFLRRDFFGCHLKDAHQNLGSRPCRLTCSRSSSETLGQHLGRGN